MSVRFYARQRGVSHVAVLKAAKAGRIPMEPDGTIDPAKADAAWDRTTDPGKSKTEPEKLKPVPETAIGSVRETLKEQGLPAGRNVTFVQARTAHEIAKAHLARLKLQERKGELVDRARATALVFRLAREERDAWVNWPARTSALMAAADRENIPAQQPYRFESDVQSRANLLMRWLEGKLKAYRVVSSAMAT